MTAASPGCWVTVSAPLYTAAGGGPGADMSSAMAWELSQLADGRCEGSLASAAEMSGTSGAGTPVRSARPEMIR